MQTSALELAGIQERLQRDGYVIVEDIFDPSEDFRQLYSDWTELLNEAIDESVEAGTMTDRYENLSFDQRFIQLSKTTGLAFFRRFDISLPQKEITPDTRVYLGPGIFSILTNKRLLDVVEALIGPEISSNPNQHVRLKLPKSVVATNNFTDGRVGPSIFHQDQGVSLPEADETDILTCWIAITDADMETACLQVYPRTAQEGVLLTHCPDNSPKVEHAVARLKGKRGIPPSVMPAEEPTPLPVRAGSAIFFKGKLVHGSFDNHSEDRLRISLDLRWQVSGLPTGRPGFPDFVARSRGNPDSELHDPGAWAQLWYDARDQLAKEGGSTGGFYRWSGDVPDCV
jgi:phytanoyl-CoA hydroxylase